MKVAVTGARGFIGSHTIKHLEAAGHRVVPLGRGGAGGQVRVDAPEAEADLPVLLDGVEGVVHLAGRSVDSLATPFRSYLDANVVLTERVVEAAASVGAAVVVLASSRMVYPAWLDDTAREDCPHPPDSFYGLSKLTAEHVLGLHAARQGFRSVALRIAQVVGPGDGGRGALPALVARARSGGPLEVMGSGVAVRDFVDVRDVARAVERALVAPTTARAINIGNGRGHTIHELASAVAEEAGLGPEGIEHVPTHDEDRSVYRLDCTLAREQLGWSPVWDLHAMVRDRLASGRGTGLE